MAYPPYEPEQPDFAMDPMDPMGREPVPYSVEPAEGYDAEEVDPNIEMPLDLQKILGIPQSGPADVMLEDSDIIAMCAELESEARNGRESGIGGMPGRDQVWQSNLDLYHQRPHSGDKEDWQSDEVLPIATKRVDRFAAALRKAYDLPGDKYDIMDDAGGMAAMLPNLKKILDVYLERCGTINGAQPAPFTWVFQQAIKLGCVTLCAVVVWWDKSKNRLRMDPIDPRELYLDPTGRGLYRLRRRNVDYHTVCSWKDEVDDAGNPIYRHEELEKLQQNVDSQTELDRQNATGEGSATSGTRYRKTVTIDEWYFSTLLDRNGKEIAKDQIIVVANRHFVIRGPEKNPYAHGRDWIITHAIQQVPLSVYGHAYIENFSALCRLYDDVTNLILDSAHTSSMRAFQAWPEMLDDPSQIDEGVRPWKVFQAGNMARPGTPFIESIDLGTFSPQLIAVRDGLKQEINEAASQNEIDLGQVPGKSDITATEVTTVRESTNEYIADVASSIDIGLLSPCYELAFMTIIQHVDVSDPRAIRELGAPICEMIAARRQEILDRKYQFRATAIGGLVDRQLKARTALQVLQLVGTNQILATEFLRKFDLGKFLNTVWSGFGIDTADVQRDQAMNPYPAVQPAGPVPPGGGEAPNAQVAQPSLPPGGSQPTNVGELLDGAVPR